jgi:hypothetical protein
VLLAGPAGANALVSIGMPTTGELLGLGPQVAVVLPINDRGDANTPGVERHRAVLGRRFVSKLHRNGSNHPPRQVATLDLTGSRRERGPPDV